MYKIPLNIGTLAGIAAFGIFMLMHAIGISPLSIGRFAGTWIPPAAILWAGFKVRRNALGGYMTYMQGLLAGFIVSMTWCTLKAFCIYIYMTLNADNNIVEQLIYFQERIASLYEKVNGEPLSYPVSNEEIRSTFTPGYLMWYDININAMFGFFCAAICAIITKRKAPVKPPQ